MQPYQQRILTERNELEKRLEKLTDFVYSNSFHGVLDAEKDRLHRQQLLMAQYLQVLEERISAWS